jgi:hypothetical protein
MESMRCAKCNGEMVLGFIFECENHKLDTWVEGPPKKSWWGGFWGGVTAPKEKRISIGTFRCSKCGFLESYARQEFGAT